jgi:hypothetical protein
MRPFLILFGLGLVTAPTIACDSDDPAAIVVCGSGTHLDGATCVRDPVAEPPVPIICGEGTTLDGAGTACVVADPLRCGDGTSRVGSACVADGSRLACGDRTERIGDLCIGTLSCGEGTTLAGNACVARDECTQLSCGSGTRQVGDNCVGTLACGEGTTHLDNVCVAEAPDSEVCGAGTSWDGELCVVLPPSGPDPDFTAFSALSSPTTSHYAFYNRDSNVMGHKIIVTTASQGLADGWTATSSPLIGDVEALHIRIIDDWAESLSEPNAFEIYDATDAYGDCENALKPTSSDPYDALAQVNFFAWDDLDPTPVVCAKGGVMSLQLDPQDASRIRVVLNVQFNDGTVWSERVLTMPYRGDNWTYGN